MSFNLIILFGGLDGTVGKTVSRFVRLCTRTVVRML